MVAEIISGKEVAKTIREELMEKVAALKKDKGVTPGLAVILVGEDPASVSYVTAKGKAAEELGIQAEPLPGDVQSGQIERLQLALVERRVHVGESNGGVHAELYRAVLADFDVFTQRLAPRRILQLARDGLPVIVVGQPPHRTPGYATTGAEIGRAHV